MGISNHRNLGISLILLGAAVGAIGSIFFPTATTTRCDNGDCVAAAPNLLNYAIAGLGSAAFLVGVALVYLAWRRGPKGYFYR